ncbi:MAG: phage scaffolding protein [Gemmiger qucibialis]
MKREEVKGILPDITDEQLTKIMDLHGADIERQKQTITTLTTERDAARTQLGDANKKLEGYDPEWKTKAEQAENNAKAQVAALQSDFAAESAVSGVQFSSESARKAFLGDLKAKKLTLQDGKLLGFDDFLADYKKTDPNAFASGYPNVRDGGDPNKTPTSSTREQFASWFNEVMK